ncbi:hypothetical protein [Pseudanabaena sp. UWO311]|nr:hypothetical protein [Pseudanabaena sp. UWO311]
MNRLPLTYPNQTAIAPIAYQLFDFVIAINLSELNIEVEDFCLLNLG